MKRLLCVLALVLIGIAAADGARYLVICADNLVASIRPLVEWRHAQGLQTKVVPVSQVGNDTTSIKNYVRAAWNTWNPRPEYLLLVGSPNLLASRYYSGQWPYSTDNPYGDMGGTLEQELPVGRLPAKSPAQLDVMITKILAYERTPDLTDTVWMRKLTTVCGDRGDSDAWVYWGDIRNAISLAFANGFVACDSFASSRGDTATGVQNSISAGTGLVVYRGTANTNWYSPFNVNPAACLSRKRLAIIGSFTCATMTLTPGESMVGEAWLKAGTVESPRGAVAFVGNTHSATNVAQVRSAMCRGFFTGLFSEGLHRLGYAVLRGKHQLYTQYPSYTSDYRGFCLLGDPALPVWTGIPRVLNVQHPASVMPESQQVVVAVSRPSTPVEGALVCLSMDSTVYVRGLTDNEGRVLLDIWPKDTGRIRIVVTGRDLCPYDSFIQVGEVGIAQPPAAVPTDRLSASPAVFRGSTRLSCPGPGSLEIYDASGTRVRTLTATTTVVWDGRDESGRDCRSGVYVARVAGVGHAAVRLLRLN